MPRIREAQRLSLGLVATGENWKPIRMPSGWYCMGPKSGPSNYIKLWDSALPWPLDFQGFPGPRSWLNRIHNWLSRFVPPNPLTWTTSRWSNRNSPTPRSMILGVNYLWCFMNQWFRPLFVILRCSWWSAIPHGRRSQCVTCHLSLWKFKAICCRMKTRRFSSATLSGCLDDFDVPHIAQLLCQVWAFHFEAVGSSQYANQHEKRRRWRCLPVEQYAEAWENRVGGAWVNQFFLVHD